MTYEELKSKWINRPLYTGDYDQYGKHSGRIGVLTVNNYPTPIGLCQVEVWDIPKFHGWRDERQRREFYADAKKILTRIKGTICAYYRIIKVVDYV